MQTTKRVLWAIAAGLAGFAFAFGAYAAAMLVFLDRFAGLSGVRPLEPRHQFVIFVVCPLLLLVGAALPAWATGASLPQSVLCGLVVSGVSLLVLWVSGTSGSSGSDARLNLIATLMPGLAVSLSLLPQLPQRREAGGAVIVVTVLLAGAAFLLPIPLLVSALLAWIGIPLVAAFFPTKATTPSPPYQSGGQRV